jgi:predicted nuclease of predicted toxin-antitoxin system
MLRLLADENFNHDLIRGVLRVIPSLDLVRVQDVGLGSCEDMAVLDWAARERRLVMTHDVNTMPAFAFERLRRNQSMPGVFVVSQQAALRSVIDDILLLAECSDTGEWDGQVIYLPLQG